MRRRTKAVLWGLAATLLLFLVLAAGALAYLYHNPSRIKDVAVRAASRAAGLDVRVEDLSWGRAPLHVQVKGVSVESEASSAGDGLRLEVEDLRAEMTLEGSFGHRTLVIERAAARGVDLTLRGAVPLPDVEAGGGTAPSWYARAGAWLMRGLLFQDVRIERAALSQARAEIFAGEAALHVDRLQASVTPERAAHASFDLRLEHRRERLRIDLPGVEFDASPSDRGPSVHGRIALQNGTLERDESIVEGLSLAGRFDLDPVRKRLRMHALDVSLPDLSPLLPEDLSFAPSVLFQGSGVAFAEERRFEKGLLRLVIRDRAAELEITGRATASWDAGLRGSVRDLVCRFRPADWMPLLPRETRDALSGVDLSGVIRLSGAVQGRVEKGALRIEPDLTLQLPESSLTFSSSPIEASGRLRGRAHIQGLWPDPALSGTVRAEAIEVRHPAVQVLPSEAVLRLGGRLSDIRLSEAEIKVPGLLVSGGDPPLALEGLRVTAGDARLDPLSGRLTVSDVGLEAEGFGPVSGSGEVQGEKVRLSLQGKKTGLLSLLSQTGWPLEGWGMKGDDTLEVQVSRDAAAWKCAVHTEVAGVAFENAPTESFGEGVDLSLDAEVRVEPGGTVVLESSTVKARAGEILLDRFYLDLNTHPFLVRARSRFDPGRMRVDDAIWEAEIGGVLSLRGSGKLEKAAEGPRFDVSLSVPSFALAPAFQLLAVEPFRMEVPALRDTTLEGRASADLRVRSGPRGLDLEGEVRLRDATLEAKEPALVLGGVNLTLPVRFGTGSDGPPEAPREGKLAIRTVGLPFLPEQSIGLAPEVSRNRVLVSGPTTLAIPGGELLLGAVDLRYDPEKGPTLETGLRMEDVDLRPLLSRVWAKSPEGRIGGELSSVRYAQGRVTSRGSFHGEVFDGRLTVSDVGASGLFTSAPLFRLDAGWEDLDLEQMTAGTAFGRVTGVLEGRLDDLEIAYGQPQRFDLLMETVPRKGVAQRISVKAVDNIAQIGGGGSPFVGLAGLFTSFFREFPYKRIGVHAVLETDVFRINGTILEGGTEYLVKRSGFSGVDVVNQNPDNQIRFKDMVKRIQRVTSSKGGPVIR